MKKYLLALSAFLLVPAGAIAQEEDDGYIEGDEVKEAAVFGYAGNLNASSDDWTQAAQTVEDKFEIICDDLNLKTPEDDANDEEQSDEENNGTSDGNEDGNEEEGNGDDHGDGQVEDQDNEQNDDQNLDTESDFEQEVIRLTNEERETEGLEPLETDSEVSDVARVKSEDMRDSDYFSHDSPNYGSPFDMMDEFGIDYMGAGENIAAGQPSPEQVVEGWMNSDGHRANILNDDFTHIGVGHAEGGSYGEYWTQMFITK